MCDFFLSILFLVYIFVIFFGVFFCVVILVYNFFVSDLILNERPSLRKYVATGGVARTLYTLFKIINFTDR